MGRESKFKIGDRVHYDDRLTKGVGTIHLRAPENEGFDWGVAVAEHDRMRAYHKGNVRWSLARDLRPALTIEPDKFYRTRSGKPTGRVTVGDTGFEAVVDGRVRIFDKAGGAVHGDDDIVEEWVPKVGERVRFVRDNTDSGSKYGAKGEVVTVTNLVEYGASKVDVTSSHLSWNPSAYLSDLEPLPVATQPAAELKIEAGKFYRTRDGRKVGPMKVWRFGGWHSDDSETPLNGGLWLDDGEPKYKGATDSPQIIAEWSTAQSNVGAQVDTIAEEYGPVVAASKPKFKVGDRVVFRNYSGSEHCYGTVEDVSVDGKRVLASDWSIGAEVGYLPVADLELADTEPDTTLHIKFTSDFSELDAAILVRKKKLKKLIKLARKAGIELREAA